MNLNVRHVTLNLYLHVNIRFILTQAITNATVYLYESTHIIHVEISVTTLSYKGKDYFEYSNNQAKLINFSNTIIWAT